MALLRRRFVFDLMLGTGLGVLLFFGLTAWLNLASMAFYAKRAELPATIDAIWAAQLGYEAAFDARVAPLEPAPRAPASADRKAVLGEPSSGWLELGWPFDGQVRGVYWAYEAPGLDGLVVVALADIDDDGVRTFYARSDWGRTTRLVEDDDVL